jgi:hypothetical protein
MQHMPIIEPQLPQYNSGTAQTSAMLAPLTTASIASPVCSPWTAGAQGRLAIPTGWCYCVGEAWSRCVARPTVGNIRAEVHLTAIGCIPIAIGKSVEEHQVSCAYVWVMSMAS